MMFVLLQTVWSGGNYQIIFTEAEEGGAYFMQELNLIEFQVNKLITGLEIRVVIQIF